MRPPDGARSWWRGKRPVSRHRSSHEDYFACGVQRVWVFYPLYSKVYDCASATEVQILTRADRLSGGEVLPSFELALSELFEFPTGAA
jgi:hypothetical protein